MVLVGPKRFDMTSGAVERKHELRTRALPQRVHADGPFEFAGGPIGSPHARHGLRYVDAVALGDGGYRLYYEAARSDGAHELRTELVGKPDG